MRSTGTVKSFNCTPTMSYIYIYIYISIIEVCVYRYASENVNKLLVGNKNDLTSQRAVSFEQGKVPNLLIHMVPYYDKKCYIKYMVSLYLSIYHIYICIITFKLLLLCCVALYLNLFSMNPHISLNPNAIHTVISCIVGLECLHS